jgi:acetyltransferase-like isoleucine patch superfamily enzyme
MVTIGEGSFLNRDVFVDGVGVRLGRNVYVGPRAMIVTAKHSIGGRALRAAPGAPEEVQVGDGCWIGAGAIILPGVTVGAGCVIAAGAVVTRDCEPDGLYAGVPARRLRDLPVDEGLSP